MSRPMSTIVSHAGLGRPAVQAPEAGAVGAEPQRSVGRPRRLDDGLGPLAAGDDRPLAAGVDDEPGGVPRHVRVVPLQPAERVAVGPPARVGRRSRARRPRPRVSTGRSASRRTIGVDDLTVARRAPPGRTGSSSRPARRRRRRSAAREATGGSGVRATATPSSAEAVQPLRRPVGEPQHTAADPPRPAAVLVHGGARVPRCGEDLVDRAVSDGAGSTAVRPPSSGRLSDHQTSSPSTATPVGVLAAATTTSLVIGDGHVPNG